MESPFFTNRRWYQHPEVTRNYPTSNRRVPVYDPYNEAHRPVHRQMETNSAPKVIRIPIRFVGSEPVDRAGSAVKIQKVFRGFLVRKCLKKVRDIKVQVEEMEEMLSKSEVSDLLRRDEKERLRMNETLMSLLFKLDSICGMDFGVRVCRKAVIRKVISLQERIDSVVTADVEQSGENDDQMPEIEVSVGTENFESDHLDNPTGFENVPEIEVSEDSNKPDNPTENSGELEDCGESVESADCNDDGIIDVGVDCEVKLSESNGDSVEKRWMEGGDDEKEGGGVVEKKSDRELLERMMEESEKMSRMMSELCERNLNQTRTLNALSHRVELLEKAFVCDMQRRRKKKAKPTATC